jgi:hypothetical protein
VRGCQVQKLVPVKFLSSLPLREILPNGDRVYKIMTVIQEPKDCGDPIEIKINTPLPLGVEFDSETNTLIISEDNLPNFSMEIETTIDDGFGNILKDTSTQKVNPK